MSEIVVPSLGESVSEATIAQWLKKEGEEVKADEPIVELETDKVTLEVNAPSDGVIAKITVQEGESVEVGAVLGEVEAGEAANDSQADEPGKTDDDSEKDDKDDKKEDNEGAKSTGGSGETKDIEVPSLGESISEATIGKWLKNEGDQVEQDEAIVELETDKATMEVNAPAAGVIKKTTASEGDTVEIGAVLGQIDVGGEGQSSSGSQSKDDGQSGASKSASAEQKKDESGSEGHKLSPAVQKMISDNNLDPAEIKGTGKDGRITKEDVQKFLEKGETKKSSPASDQKEIEKAPDQKRETGEREERVKMTKLRQSIAKRLKEAQNTAAMLTTFNEVDMSAVMALRSDYKESFKKKHGVKLGFMSFFVKAAVNALKDFPEVNAEIDGDEIVYKNYYDISVAVSTPQGLVVPVVRDCDEKSMAQIEKDISDVGGRARDGKLSISEMMGGTFTITNGGIFGSLLSTPIINPPQTAILGMHKIQQRPMVMDDGSIEARPMMYLAMSYDHRLIDGKEAVSFLVAVKNAIEDPQRLILDI